MRKSMGIRILAGILSVIMVFTSANMTVFAASDNDCSNFVLYGDSAAEVSPEAVAEYVADDGADSGIGSSAAVETDPYEESSAEDKAVQQDEYLTEEVYTEEEVTEGSAASDTTDEFAASDMTDVSAEPDESGNDNGFFYKYVEYVNPEYRDLDVTFPKKITTKGTVSRSLPMDDSSVMSVEQAARTFRNALKERKSSCTVITETGDVDAIMNKALAETSSPKEGDYIRSNLIAWGGSISGFVGDNVWTVSLSFVYTDNAKQETIVDEKVKDIIATYNLAGDSLSEADKIKVIHDYLVDNIVYQTEPDTDGSFLRHSSYAALVKGSCVCQGYASAFYRLCREAGLSARYITGTCSGGAHAWNIVRVGDEYYNIDATWDDPIGGWRIFYSYFLKNEDDFKSHVRDSDYTSSAFCSSYPIASSSYSGAPIDRDNDSYFLPDIRGEYLNTGTSSRAKMIVLYDLNESEEVKTALQTYASALWKKRDKIDVVAVECSGSSCESVSAFADSVDPLQTMEFAYCDALTGDTILSNYSSITGLPATTPMYILTDDSNNVMYADNTAFNDAFIYGRYAYYLNEGAIDVKVRAYADESALASERYTYIDTLDIDYHQTRYIRGEAVVRKDPIEGFISDVSVSIDDPDGVIEYEPSNGLIRGLKPGSALITFTSVFSPTASKTIAVTVKSVNIRSIALSRTELRMAAGCEDQLSVIFTPDDVSDDKTIQWESTNPDVATVDPAGCVRGVSGGKAVIRATSSNGKKAECSVLVYVPVENVSIEALGLSVCDEYTMTVGDKLSFCAMIEPCNSDLQSEDLWSVSGDGVLDIQVKDYGNAVIAEALKEGQAILTYSVDSHSASVTVNVIQPGISDIVIPDEYEYTGKAIVPKVVVKSGENVLKEGVDYSLKFRNNVNAYTYREGESGFYDANGRTSAPSVTVTGKGNYAGTFTNYFIIRPKKITDYDINVDEATLVKICNGKTRKLVPVIKWGSRKLTNKDYTISYPDHEDGAYTRAGRYSVVVTGKNNYTGTLNLFETILNKDLINISKCKISGIKNAVYSGEPIVQSGLSVKYKNSVLVQGKDYILAYRGNISAGTAKVVITGIGEYCGTVIKTFKITGTSISKAVVTGGLDALTYTGDSLTPKLILTYKDKLGNVRTLIEYAPSGSPSYGYGGTTADRKQADYKVEYDTNIKSGSGKVIITGLNGYTGKVTRKFKIKKAPITGSNIDVDYGDIVGYRKGGAKPTDITVIRRIGYEETKLTEGKDYTIVCYNNKSVNTGADQATAPYFLIKGKGEYSGTTAVKDKYVFSITQTCIDSVDISVPDMMYKNKPGNFISKMTVKDVDGKTLKADTDYDLRNAIYYLAECAYVIHDKGESAVRLDVGEKLNKTDTVVIDEDNANGVSIRICFDGLGNYGGVAEREYRIVDKSIASAKLAEPITRYYTGEEITLSVNEIRLMDGNTQISSENYEIVPGSYKKNVNKGTASVTVRGISGYGGTKTINFKIVSHKISEGGILDFLRR